MRALNVELERRADEISTDLLFIGVPSSVDALPVGLAHVLDCRAHLGADSERLLEGPQLACAELQPDQAAFQSLGRGLFAEALRAVGSKPLQLKHERSLALDASGDHKLLAKVDLVC